MLGKVGTEPTLKQLLLRFYHQRRPQKQLVLGGFVPSLIPQLPNNLCCCYLLFIYYLFTFICSQFLLTLLLATTLL